MNIKWSAFLGFLFLSLSHVFAHDPAGWQSVLIPHLSVRTVNDIQVLDQNTIVIVGGNETNDSIRSIFVSTDKGQQWSIIIDTPGRSWLTSVHFVNTMVGFAVGFDGAVLKTTTGGFSWVLQTVPTGVRRRHFNSVFFINDQIGFIAGGNRSNDSIQTILKTTDGGNTWNIQRDGLGYWLKSIYFTDSNNGYAVGEQGVVLKTTDGGNNWSQLSLPGNAAQRNFNTVCFLDANIGFLGGGNRANDSIRTILKTIDGGNNWNIITDSIAPWIRDISFSNASTGFAVGDYGTILLTEDAGTTWNQIPIPGSVNDSIRGIYAVHFLNSDFGAVGGQIGKTLIYEDSSPTSPSLITGFATEIDAESAVLNGTVDANGTSSTVTFEYGKTVNLANSVAGTPGTVSGTTVTAVSAQISGLDSNTLYYYRVKASNSSGTNYGVIRQFYSGRNRIPNWDFETWKAIQAFVPDTWISLGANEQVLSYDGSWAVSLKPSPRTEVGAILHGIPSDHGSGRFYGGAPLAARPDSLIGYFRYDIAVDDSAAILLIFKKNGVINSQQFYYITGSSNNTFQRLSFPITYTDGTIPDSVVLGFISSNPASETPDTSNKLAIDNISFAGTTLNVPNAGFESWITNTGEEPSEWTTSGSEAPIGLFTPPVTKTTDSQHGNYAARLENILELDGTIGRVEAGAERNAHYPVFPVYGRHLTFNIYLKYFPQNGDSATIRVEMYKSGQSIGGVTLFVDSTVSNYTLFSIPLVYQHPTVIPDSAAIQIESGRNRQDFPPVGASVLYVDNLGFDGFYKGEFSVDAGENVTICEGDTVIIGASPVASGGLLPYSYNWSPTATLNSGSVANPLAFPASTTTYHLTVTDANGITDSSSVTVTVDVCIGIEDEPVAANQSVIYPNPAQDNLFITVHESNREAISVSLLDLRGRELQKRKVSCNGGTCSVNLDLKDVSNGCYFIAVQKNASLEFRKLIVQR